MKWITIILVLISLTATGQGNRVKKEYRDSVANENVQTLKDGVLLVRLRSSQKSLQALLKRGDTIGERNKAREIRLKQLEIVNAFKVKYHFSDVYFFYSHHTSAVMEKQWDGVILNDSLVSDGFKPEKYLIVDPYRIQFDAMGTSQSGLSVMNADFEQLEKPFPYYVRKRKAMFFMSRDQFEMVTILQSNLEWIEKRSNH